MHDIKKACLQPWNILLCIVKIPKLARFKTKAKVGVGRSEPAFSLGGRPSSQCHPLPSPCWLSPSPGPAAPLGTDTAVVSCRRQRWLWSRGTLKQRGKGALGWVWKVMGCCETTAVLLCICAASSEPWTWAVLRFASLHRPMSWLTWSEPVVVLLSEGCSRWSAIRRPFYLLRLFFNLTLLSPEHTQHSLTPSMRAGVT